jgi:hypothetical protein
VRINPVTAAALNLDVNSSGNPPPYDSTTPLYFDGTGLNLNSSGMQALEVTAFAYMPDKSTRMLQYVVAPLNLNFPAALTLDGNGVTYAGPTGPNSNLFSVSGNDPTPTSVPARTCISPPPSAPVPAVGYTNSGDYGPVSGGTNPNQANYTGYGYVPPPPPPGTPSVGQVNVNLPANFQKPSTLDALVQTISRNADVTINGPATQSSMPTSANPMVVVVNGDLDLSGWNNTGYGLLLVMGKLTYDPDASWEGIVLVIGNEVDPVTFEGAHSGGGRIDGAVLVAQTRDATGKLLPDPNLGPASVKFDPSFHPTPPSAGIYYNTCAISQAQSLIGYQVLSFREITPP